MVSVADVLRRGLQLFFERIELCLLVCAERLPAMNPGLCRVLC